jgi:hypothetical protein
MKQLGEAHLSAGSEFKSWQAVQAEVLRRINAVNGNREISFRTRQSCRVEFGCATGHSQPGAAESG